METFSSQFTLNKDYLAESYDQSLPHGKNARPNFWLPAAMFAFGVALLQFTAEQYPGWMLIALAALELLHIRYRRAWWLMRQTWGKGDGVDVRLTIDESGIQTESTLAKTAFAWSEIQRVIETDLGLILVTESGGQQYLSKSILADEIVAHVVQKIKTRDRKNKGPEK
jgi:hypothetical protein